MGFTGKIRREFKSAVQRCGHSKEKFDTLLDTLEVLSAWAVVKHKEAVEAHEKRMAECQARTEQAARDAVFQESVKAGDTIHIKAEKADEFWEVSPRNGAILAVHNVSDHPSGPVTALATQLIQDGRNPTSVLEITVHGKPCIGHGKTLQDIVGTASQQAAAEETSSIVPAASKASVSTGGLKGVRTA